MPFILRIKLKFSLQRGADLAQELTTGARHLRTNNSVRRTDTLITRKQNVLNIEGRVLRGRAFGNALAKRREDRSCRDRMDVD